ncbi:hypothetical protein OROHE_017199 [Orobanche hederae]
MSTSGLTMSAFKSTDLRFDEHGVIKVIKVGVNIHGVAYVVETWGDPDPSKSVVAASLVDNIEFYHPCSGEIYFTKSKSNKSVARICLFHKDNSESSFSLYKRRPCESRIYKGIEKNIRPLKVKEYDVADNSEISCFPVYKKEKYSLFGGKLHNLSTSEIILISTFLSHGNDDFFVEGSNKLMHDPEKINIQAVTEGLDEYSICIGTNSSDLLRLHWDTENKFFGGTTTSGYRHETKCDQPPIAVSGNIKFMAIHPMIACGVVRTTRKE